MQVDIVTIFPAMVEHALGVGVVGRAIERGALTVRVRDLRDYTTDRHRVVDDVPYGGGPGMVLKPEPMLRAIDAIEREAKAGRPRVILMSPQGTRFTQSAAARLSAEPHVALLCGRYEGIDERVRSRVDEELSIGDFVLSGGELPALVVVDAMLRLVPGVVGDEQSVEAESFSRGLLDFPHYTRPAVLNWPEAGGAEVESLRVPDVLTSGNHAEIRRWRKRQSLARTLERRPDLLETAELDDEARAMLRELEAERDRVQARR
ncbi:MAG TPA: tRNA (guanosine(37)-N1)-methyltransferase TrmD [Vicinamibacterales bacterium]|jgi:tRNA (guanine37-N1)-methyltransferase|nr:tRNA (guanosine(37)-N1)-methyltransferase TrmD [Vicinamibacterales bacterium]